MVDIGDITKEIYGKRIVEQLEKESFLLNQFRDPNAPKPKPWQQERACTADDLKFWSGEGGELDLDCINCREWQSVQDSTWVSIKKMVAEFPHKVYKKG